MKNVELLKSIVDGLLSGTFTTKEFSVFEIIIALRELAHKDPNGELSQVFPMAYHDGAYVPHVAYNHELKNVLIERMQSHGFVVHKGRSSDSFRVFYKPQVARDFTLRIRTSGDSDEPMVKTEVPTKKAGVSDACVLKAVTDSVMRAPNNLADVARGVNKDLEMLRTVATTFSPSPTLKDIVEASEPRSYWQKRVERYVEKRGPVHINSIQKALNPTLKSVAMIREFLTSRPNKFGHDGAEKIFHKIAS